MIGVYRIQNLANGKNYVGSSENLEQRLQTHKTNMKNNSFTYCEEFKKDLLEFSEEDFKFEVLKELNTANELESWENYYIGFFNSIDNGYNTLLSRRRPNVNMRKYEIEGEQLLSIFELVATLKLGLEGYEELEFDIDLPHIRISKTEKRFLLSEVLTYLNAKKESEFNDSLNKYQYKI